MFPEFSGKDRTIEAGISYRDEDGNVWTEVHMFDNKGDGVTKTRMDVSSIMRETLKDKGQKVSFGGAFSNIKLEQDRVFVKTNEVPAAGKYNLQETISNYTYAARKKDLAPGEHVYQELKLLPGNFRIGFATIGSGRNSDNSKKPPRYKIWWKDPNGVTHLDDSQEFSDEIGIGKALQVLEETLPQMAAAFVKKP